MPSFTERDFSENPKGDFDGDGLSELDGDCDDTQPLAYPGAEEVCDGIDNDCDGDADEDDATDATLWYGDGDHDGYGITTYTITACDQPEGFAAELGDCDDTLAGINPGATETCSGYDDDCDGLIDDEDPSMEGLHSWHLNADGDGYGDDSVTVEGCEPPPGYVYDGGDCDDLNRDVYPGATEVCNERDDDCDGLTDDADADMVGPETWYPDEDGDGYGSSALDAVTIEQCSQPEGYTADADDCDDADAEISPEGAEVCNEVDDDCDGVVDDGVQTTYFLDSDGDGFGNIEISAGACEVAPSGYVSDATDCDDLNVSVHPEADEFCDEIDNDCDEYTDESDAVDATVWYRDADEDGYGDDDVSESSCSSISGYVDVGGDCEDAMAGINPDATETCYTTDDDDCSGSTNDEGATACVTWYLDDDGDGYGTEDDDACLCVAEGSYRSRVTGDCDDSDTTISPDDLESCDSVDNDCDGDTDEEDADDCTAYFYDWDGDGYGVNDSRCLCSDDGYYRTTILGDCDDEDASISPDSLSCGLYGDVSNDGAAAVFQNTGATSNYQLLSSTKSYHGNFDYNLDGHADLVMGNVQYDSSYSDAGAVLLFLGPIEGSYSIESSSDADLMFTVDSAQAYCGSEVGVGDFDGDGRVELIIGSVGSGRSFLVEDGMTGFGTLTDTSAGIVELAYEYTSIGSVAAVGDVNDDGFDDAILSYTGGSSSYSVIQSYIAYGSTSGLQVDTYATTHYGTYYGAGASTDKTGLVGSYVSSGDLDGDGVTDVIVAEIGVGIHVVSGVSGSSFDPTNTTTTISGGLSDTLRGPRSRCSRRVNRIPVMR